MSTKTEYYTTSADGKIQIFSKVPTNFVGKANNFVAEVDTLEDAKNLMTRLKLLRR